MSSPTSPSTSSGATATTEVTKALSSFGHFQKLCTQSVREELQRAEQDHAMGAIMTALSARYKALSPSEKAVYDDLAAADKERYAKETAQRDAEFLAIQEERRRQNATTSFDSRARNTTVAMTDAVLSKTDAPKRKRVVTEDQKQAREKTKQAKAEEERRIDVQHQEITDSKSVQAEARLKYLLSQSDIFSHFGLKAAKKEEPTTSKKEERDRDRKKDRKGVVYDELDDDERALIEDAGDDSDEESEKKPATTTRKGHVLLRQPSIITGGEMR